MKKNILLLRLVALSALLSLFYSPVIGQTGLQKARESVANYEYATAIEQFNEYFKTTTPGIVETREIATCYMMSGDTKSAEEWFKKVMDFDSPTNADFLMFAKALHANGRYKEAIKQYQDYGYKEPNDVNKVNKWVASCKKATEWVNSDTILYQVANVSSLNSENSEFGMFPFDNAFIFSSDKMTVGKSASKDDICGWTGKPYLKLYLLPGINNTAITSQPIAIEALNQKYHDGQGVYDSPNKTLYFTRTNMGKMLHPINSDPTSWVEKSASLSDQVNHLEIYTAAYNNGNWRDIKPFVYNNPLYSVGHPALSPDGKILYFSSDMPGGYGSADIYFCERTADGNWTFPRNAGKTINTEGKEVFPYMDKNGTLYFSSDGHVGMGGLDIFAAKGSKDSWSAPQNMKYPVNSAKDDFSICFAGSDKTGYFSSNRFGGKGMDDIYYFSPAPRPMLVGTTLEQLKNGSTVELKNAQIENNNITDNLSETLQSNEKGKFITTVDYNKSYQLTLTKEGYHIKPYQAVNPKRKDGDTIYVKMIAEKLDPLVIAGVTKEQLGGDTLIVLKNANVKIENTEDGTIINTTSDNKGRFYSRIEVAKPYLISISKEGYFAQTRKLTTKQRSKDTVFVEMNWDEMKDGYISPFKTGENNMLKDSIRMVISTKIMAKNKAIIMRNIYYDYDKWDIRADAAIELDKIAKIMKENPTIRIEISSNTDSRGPTAYNDTLSQKRAESSVKYVISQGIEAPRLVAKGYGERHLLNKCSDGVICTDAQHQENRRTEFKVIDIGKGN